MDNRPAKNAVTTGTGSLGVPDQVSDRPDNLVAPPGGSPPGASKGGLLRYFAGHPTGFWFFFWGELAERSCFYGMRAILFLYMVDKLGFGEDNAQTINYLFVASCYFLPLIGGYLADNFFGKYWTIVGFSLPYIIGQLFLCFDSGPVLGVEPRYFLFVSLGLLAMGSGVIKPNISTLMGLTYDQYRPGQTQLRSDAFSFFYMAINIGAFLSSFLMPKLRTNYGYHVAFMFPAGLMALALTLFALGKPFYAREVINRADRSPDDRDLQWVVLGRLLGVFLALIPFWMIFDQSSATWILFAKQDFDLRLGVRLPFLGDTIDPDQFQALNPLFIIVLLPFISVGLWRLLARFGLEVRPTDKMLAGFVLTAASMAVMAGAGVLAVQGHKVSIWWQVGTYFLITVAELCISPVGLELAFTAAPKSMKGFITGCFLLTIFFGDVLNSWVTRYYTRLGPAVYFGLMTGLMLVVTVAFVFIARHFNRTVEPQPELPAGAGEHFAAPAGPSEQVTPRGQVQKPE